MTSGHFAAAFRASAADRCATRHFHVAPHRLARRRASVADLRTRSARFGVKRRVARHEVGGGLADLDAVHHQADMFRLGVTVIQAMVEQQRLAGVAAGPAMLDAVMQLWIGVMMHVPLLCRGNISACHIVPR
jgi:hypothetical protein